MNGNGLRHVGRRIWRAMTQFWGTLFGINLAVGVAAGTTMEFQFGANWACYSHYVDNIFGVPLAQVALLLESTFVGLFFFGWYRLSKINHLLVTWPVAIDSSVSALWILFANGWIQNPVREVRAGRVMRGRAHLADVERRSSHY